MTEEKMRKDDRILVLKPVDGAATSSTGMVDSRLFKGENRLHVIMDPKTLLWHFQYDSGILPGPLKSHFTSFKKALDFVTEYFKRRNIQIVEIQD